MPLTVLFTMPKVELPGALCISLLAQFLCRYRFFSLYRMAALIPWFTTYAVLSVSWIAITTRKIGITPGVYLKELSIPVAATLTMATAIQLVSILGGDYLNSLGQLSSLIIKCGIGASTYIMFLWVFDKRIFNVLRTLRRT